MSKWAEASRQRDQQTAEAEARFAAATGNAPLPDLSGQDLPAAPAAYPPLRHSIGLAHPIEVARPSAGPPIPLPRGKGLWVLLALLGAAAIAATPWNSLMHGISSGTVDVLYEVDGTAYWTNVTLESSTGTVQLSGESVPLQGAGKSGLHCRMERGQFVYLSAQNTGNSGTITCRITVDGVVVSTNTSSGGYSIAICDGTAR